MPTLKEAKDKVRELSQKGLSIAESNSLTLSEQKAAIDPIEADIKKLMSEIKDLEYIDEQRKSFLSSTGGSMETAAVDTSSPSAGVYKSLGQQFIESPKYRTMVASGLKGNIRSGDIELKTTLTEGNATTPGGGYAAIQTPAVLPGVVDIRFKPLTIADLFPNGVTTTPLIRYLVETSVTNAAAPTLEGGLKPESAIAFGKVDETVKKIATFLPVSEEMLEDFDQIQSYIDARLTLFVKQAEETQLLSGSGTDPNLLGLLNRSGLAPAIAKGTAPSVAADNDMDVIYRQITQIRTTAWLEPDAIVIDPTAWQTVTLGKASGTGNYLGNGPFGDALNPTLWGKKVVVTPAIAAGTALVGCFQQGGQIFRKGGLTVDASNSHADYFQRNILAIRCEERLALAIYRPSAYGVVSGL